LIGLSFTFSLNAATSGIILLSGSQPGILEITVSSEPSATSLPLTTTATDLKVGTVVERSNKKDGYKIMLGSANAESAQSATPSFTSTTTGDVLPYSIKYGGAAVTFIGGAPAMVSDVAAKTVNKEGDPKEVTVSFDGASAHLTEAIYSDTLTFSIMAK